MRLPIDIKEMAPSSAVLVKELECWIDDALECHGRQADWPMIFEVRNRYRNVVVSVVEMYRHHKWEIEIRAETSRTVSDPWCVLHFQEPT